MTHVPHTNPQSPNTKKKKMIEINVKAKPFNPVEDILGTELFWMMDDCHLIGWHYFSDKPPADKKKEVLVVPKIGKFGPTVDMIIKKFPHDGGVVAGEVNIFENDTAKVLVTASWELYDNWLKATEICKLMGPKYPEDKDVVKYIHQIVVNNYHVVLNKEGALVGVQPTPKKPPTAAKKPGGMFGAGLAYANLAPVPQVQMMDLNQAAQQMQADFELPPIPNNL